MKIKSALSWLWLTALVILIDQLTKFAANRFLVYAKPVKLTSFFNFTLSYNTGSAFGFLNDGIGWQVYFFGVIAVVVSIALLIWLWQLHPRFKLKAAGIALVLGGALGNLIDRFQVNYVTDFLDFHLADWHFATFNVADMGVSIGAFLLILSLLLQKEK